MTHVEGNADAEPQVKVVSPHKSPSAWTRFWAASQFVLCLALACGVLAYLLWGSKTAPAAADDDSAASETTVRVAGPATIRIDPNCTLAKKLEVCEVQTTKIHSPVLIVTGTVAASLRPAEGKGADYWQFNSPELLTAFTDWEKARADITFAETQLVQVKQLVETRANAQQKLADRMTRLVAAGTDTEKDLAAAQADLIQSQIQGRKDVHEAETAVRIAKRNEAALARQLQQAGLDPELLLKTTSDIDIVMADVPEGAVARVKLGQGCEARFFGLPDQLFTGQVRAMAPVISKERRSLRVLFAIRDPQDQLRPGMFADIGLGTDARSSLLLPPEGLVHVGQCDYVLVAQSSGDWRVTEVHAGEVHDGRIEILDGLQAGDRVACHGAILLKPYIIESLQPRTPVNVRTPLGTGSFFGPLRCVVDTGPTAEKCACPLATPSEAGDRRS